MRPSHMMLLGWLVWLLLSIYRATTGETQAEIIFAACNLVSSNVFLVGYFITRQIEDE